MEKNEVIAEIVRVFTNKLTDLNSALENTRDRVREAPGSNVTHSDTSKYQFSYLALGIEKQIMECQRILEQLRSLPTTSSVKIGVGSLFTLRNVESKEQKTFIIISRGGEKITIGDVEIMTLSVAAPMARLYLGKKVNDKVAQGGDTFEIIEIR